MVFSIRNRLWSAFAVLATLIVVVVGLNLRILQTQRRHDYQLVRSAAPLLDAVNTMNDTTATIVSAARGYLLTQQSRFIQQYDDAVREFEKASTLANQLATDRRDVRILGDMRRHFIRVRALTVKQISLMKAGHPSEANEAMLDTARLMSSAPDYAGTMTGTHRHEQDRELEEMGTMRLWLTLLLILASVGIIGTATFAISRIEQSLRASIEREVRRTEAVVAGMADGVMLVDREGNTVFINPAGQKMLGRDEIGVPIFKQSEVYRFLSESGGPIAPKELPSALALSSGCPVRDTTMMIGREDRQIAISMNATPLKERGRTTGAIVTFRDVTERRHLEEEMQRQAERAQILADAGGYFSSNIDRVWVTQAIAERVAEVLGDWSAVVLKSGHSNELRVASIHHRDIASLGLAWSYIYRQPLAVGEGIIGQVVSTGYPSLTMNLGATSSGLSPKLNETSYHAPSMQLASLLILPLRTGREILGALVIAANDPNRVMTDANLPLAEDLAERAALAIENSRLYTEQVDARRKVEDLSRLKDEFLSIASHELRTPVTSIKGYTQLAKTLIRENDLATSEEYLDVALDQIDRMSRLILELLDVSRIETGRLEIRHEPIQWATFVRDVVRHHHTAVSDRRFRLSTPDDSKFILGDHDRLEQVLDNLLENAAKYSPDGSEIDVTIEEGEDRIVTSISDHGIGIPVDELGQVFERFHRGRHVSSTNYGGLGLGLFITKQIVDRHGGTIWVESREGSGTSFFFSLPLAPVPAEVATETIART